MNIAVVITPVIWAAEEDYDEGNAPSIYLNASMFTQIIRDQASSTEELSTSFFKWIFANRLSW